MGSPRITQRGHDWTVHPDRRLPPDGSRFAPSEALRARSWGETIRAAAALLVFFAGLYALLIVGSA